MADDISKVVQEMREHGAIMAANGRDPSAIEGWADRIESAAPVEVDVMQLQEQAGAWEAVFCTLSSIQPQWHDSTPARPSKEMACEFIANLARQLAESKAEADETANNLNAMIVYWREATGQAESALAAATRRVAEVEGAGRRLRLDYVRMLETARDRIRDLGGECDPVDVMERADPALLAFDAALQKEPTTNEDGTLTERGWSCIGVVYPKEPTA